MADVVWWSAVDACHVAGRALPKLLSLAVVLAAMAALLPAQALSAKSGSKSSLVALQTGVLAQLNQIRRSNGLVPLRLNSRLSAAANQHNSEMLAKGYFAHNSADGSAFWKRVQRFYGSTSFGYWSVGENLLWSSDNLDPKKALELWMASPEHKKNILTPGWREIGISALQRSHAAGAFNGYAVTLLTTDFGVRH
jgi:uncharacterized protein YkwD